MGSRCPGGIPRGLSVAQIVMSLIGANLKPPRRSARRAVSAGAFADGWSFSHRNSPGQRGQCGGRSALARGRGRLRETARIRGLQRRRARKPPYYWQVPSNLQFNATTYRWIRAGLKAGAKTRSNWMASSPIEFAEVISDIFYTLSTADQSKLAQAQIEATNEQLKVLQAWQSTFGALPTDPTERSQPIDLIIGEIANTWAAPPTDLSKLMAAPDPNVLLNKVPPAGRPVVPALLDYLSKIGSIVPLLNQLTRNNDFLRRSLANLQTPTVENGGLILSDGCVVPAYADPIPINTILSGLSSQAKSRTVRLELATTPRQDGALERFCQRRSIDGSCRFPDTWRPMPVELGLALAATGAKSVLAADFTRGHRGLFLSPPFSTETLKNWYWTDPMVQAIENGRSDVLGFQVLSVASLRLTSQGQFGCVTSVIITRNPSISVVTSAPDAGKAAAAINGGPADLAFLIDRSEAIPRPGAAPWTARLHFG